MIRFIKEEILRGFVTLGKDGTIKSSGNFWRTALV